jgi:16S rRNA (cytosine967-C5)-methyltransferase
LEGANDEGRVGLLTFHPAWFVQYCFRLLGRSEALAFLEADNRQPPTYITLNTLRADEEEILSGLTEEDIEAEKVEPLRNVYKIIRTRTALTRTRSYRNGLFSTQDKTSSIVAETANPQPEMTVLDICAAPGVITSCLAQLMQNKGAIYSVDYSPRRMRTWKERVKHLGVDIAEPMIANSDGFLPFNFEADVVVLDPPSTSTGTFARFPSAKWRLTPLSIERMAELQWRMLNTCADHVRSAGTLVYTTSSITVEENEMVIERFLKWHPEYTLTEPTPKTGSPGLRGLAKAQRLCPQVHQCNGGFIAKLTRE